MNIWIARDNKDRYLDVIFCEKKPIMGRVKEGLWDAKTDGLLMFMNSEDFQKFFGFTPEKGSCREIKIKLETSEDKNEKMPIWVTRDEGINDNDTLLWSEESLGIGLVNEGCWAYWGGEIIGSMCSIRFRKLFGHILEEGEKKEYIMKLENI